VVEVEPGYGEDVFCLCVSNGVAASDSDVGTGVFGPYRATDGHAEVRLPPARSLRGRVAGPGGKPVQGVEITARPRPPEGWTDPEDGYGTWTGPGVRGITDAEGRFELGGLGDMGYWIHAEALIGLRAPSPAWIPVGAQDETIELRMRRAMVYRVTLLGADGLPLARARVSVGAADGNLRVQFEADAQGVATLVDLDPQVVYELSVSDTFPYTSRHGSRSLAPRWTPRDETFKVEPGLAVAGVVVDAEGEPLRGALVFIERARGWVERDEADGAGRFSFWLPGPATVRLAAAFPERYDFGERPAEYPVRTTAGTTELVLRAVSRRDLTLTIDWSGAPETISCPVRLTRLDSTGDGRADTRLEHASRSRPLGFRDLEPGARYRLWSGALKDGWYLLADVSPADTSLPVQAQRGGEIEGRLLLPDGVGNASVGVYRPGVGIQAQASIEDGRFLLRGVPAGEWDLTARCATPTRRYGVTVKVRTGDRPTIDMTDALIDEDE
jgi:hypothetical protein